ncbi:MAG: leucine-rich repeat domain-containing protein, partial [Bacteroidales bacterium]|nr:leucine-rich repeat domain-containing protein [Bacteroidales bacterium]
METTNPTLTVNLTDLQQVLNDADFDNTEQIREIIVPETFIEFDNEREFMSMCGCLKEINVHPDNPAFSSEFGVLFNKDKTILLFCPRGMDGHYQIPNSVTRIVSAAFDGCVWLNSITIPDSITEIEDGTFNGCMGFTEIEIPESVTKIGNYAFSECFGLKKVFIPKTTVEISETAFSGCMDF